MKRFLVSAVGVLLLASCSEHVSESDFPGTYTLKNGNAVEIVEVVAGGTYKHRMERDGTLVFGEFGYWDKDDYEGSPGITFKSFQVALQTPLKPKGYWFVVPERSPSGGVLLCVEDYLCFEKN